MPFLILTLLGVMLFLLLKNVAVLSTIMAVLISGMAVAVLVGIWQGTSYFSRQSSNQTYRQIESNLKQIGEDLQQIRSQLADVEPHLRDLEFLKYAPQDTEVKK